MKKKNIVTIIGLAITLSSIAQSATVTWGELSKEETVFQNLINCDNGEMIKYSYKSKRSIFTGEIRTPFLTKYDSKLREIKTHEFIADEKGIVLEGFLKLKNFIYLRTSKYDRETKSTTHFAQPININTLNPEGELINFGVFLAKNKIDEAKVNFVLSADSSKVLVFATTPYKKSENEKYFIAVYDNDMKKLWSKSVELPYLDKYVEMFSFFVTNQGDVGVLLKHFDQDVKKEAIKVDGVKIAAYKEILLIYKPSAEKPVELILDLGNKFVNNVDLSTNSKDNFTLFGLYKDKEKGHITGYFVSNVDVVSNKVTLAKQAPFPDELIELLDIDDQGSKNKKDPGLSSNFKFREVVQRDNGSKDYLLEFYREKRTSDNTNGVYVSHTLYEYGDIVDINIALDGKTIFTRIPKVQHSMDFDWASGFSSISYKNKLYLFYNDNNDNITRDLSRRPDKCNNIFRSSFTMAEINVIGELTRQEVYSNRDVDGTTYTKFCKRIAKNKINIFNQRSGSLISAKKDMLGFIELK